MPNKYNRKNENLFNSINRLSFHLSLQRKRQLFLLLILMLLLSFAEAISLASIIPFIGVFLDPEIFFSNPKFSFFINFFNITTKEKLFFPITVVFISVLVISFIIKRSFLHLSNKITVLTEADFKSKIFKYNINQNYDYHLKKNSNLVMSSMTQKTTSVAVFINCILQILSALMISIFILTVLILVDPLITLSIIGIVGIFFIVLFIYKKKRLEKISEEISINQDEIINIFQDSIGYIKETILYSLQNIFTKKFDNSSYKIAKNLADIKNLSEAPRIYLEFVALLLLVLLISYFNQNKNDFILDLTVLAALGFAAQKVLPLINRIHNNATTMMGSKKNLLDVLDLLDSSKIETTNALLNEKITLKESIKLKNVNFSFNPSQKLILKNINLEIKKGDKIGIKGTTGSGKTTLGHLIVGLLNPTDGQLIIDDVVINDQNKNSWYKNISVIPQVIFLNDVSIAQNIAIGIDPKDIDMKKIKEVAKQAHLIEFIESLSEKYETRVGERGVKLSGGQRQRIGIARALYRKAKIILFDEATNQLDTDTEASIMSSISDLDKEITVIFITHRLSTLKYCDQIIDLDKF